MSDTPAARPLFDGPKAFYDHLVKVSAGGGFPSVQEQDSGSYVCRYRGEGGAKCVVGHTIPDDAYEPGMEYKEAAGLYHHYPELLGYVPPGMDLRDMLLAQRAHDDTATNKNNGPKPWSHVAFVDRLKDVPAFEAFATTA